MDDTTGRGRKRYYELLRAMQPYERAEKTVALSKMVRELAVEGIRARFPKASEEEIRVRLVVRLYGREAATRLFGHIPHDAR